MQKLYFFIGLAVMLFSCTPAKEQKKPEPSSEYTSVHYYECNNTFAFTAAYTLDSVRVVLQDQAFILPHVVSASGAKYETEEAMLWNKGSEALFEYKNTSYSGCKNNSIEATWQKAKLSGVDFRAIGQEPGWILELRNDKHIQFAYNYGQDTVYTPVPKPATEDSLRFTAVTEAHQLNIDITKERCTDSMNGAEFPLSVIVNLDGKKYSGCGRVF